MRKYEKMRMLPIYIYIYVYDIPIYLSVDRFLVISIGKIYEEKARMNWRS